MPSAIPGLARGLALAGAVACTPGTAQDNPTTGEATSGQATAGHSTGHAPNTTAPDLPSTTLPTSTGEPTSTTLATEPSPVTTGADTTASDESGSPPPPLTPFEIPVDQLVALDLGFIIDGPGESARIGDHLARLNDWNGDGVNELAIRSTETNEQWAFVLFGGAYQGVVDLKTAGAMGQAIIISGMGGTVSSLGDFNGDGLDDLGMDNDNYEIDGDIDDPQGRVYVAWGQPKDFDFLKAFAQGHGSQLTGHLIGQGIGHTAGAGDVNGDGLDDMMFDAGFTRLGVLFGNPKPADLSTQNLQAKSAGYLVEGFSYPWLMNMGDVNNDMLADALGIGFGGTTLVGAYGKQDTLSVPFADLKSGLAGFVIDASTDYDELSDLGSGGATLGDFDGDGFDDIVLLARGAPSDRRVVMLRGANPWPLPTFDAFRDAGRLRHIIDTDRPIEVAFVPDLNGDGRAELLLGDVDHGGGAAFLVFGSETADPVSVDTLATTQTGVRFFNSATKSISFGWGVQAHDLTGDGVVDLLIGENRASPQGRPDAGRIYVIDGAALKALMATW